MRIRNVLFDLDGTLLDTSEGVLESAVYAARKMGYSLLPHEIMRTFIGPPIQQSFKTHYHASEEEAKRAASFFREYYKSQALLKAVPYEGIFSLCDLLQKKGLKLAVATYKREDYALTLLKHFHFDRYMTTIHGADMEGKLTKADIVDLCISEMGGIKGNNDKGSLADGNADKESDTVLIGDTEHDGLGAMRAGVDFLAVTYGFGFSCEEQAKEFYPIGIAHSPMEIAKVLQNNW